MILFLFVCGALRELLVSPEKENAKLEPPNFDVSTEHEHLYWAASVWLLHPHIDVLPTQKWPLLITIQGHHGSGSGSS